MASTGFFCAFLVGIAVTILGLVFLTPISRMLGSTPTIQPYTETYLGIYPAGSSSHGLVAGIKQPDAFSGECHLCHVRYRTGGNSEHSFRPTSYFYIRYGYQGAAIATLASQICSFLLLLYLDSRGTNIRIRFKHFSPTPALLKEIIYGGSPSLCRQGLASLATILLNVSAGVYGDAAIAGMSIVTRICMFINSFVIGFGQGFQPFCGFNYGAGFYRRVRKGFWYCVKTGIVFLALCSIVGYVYAPEIVAWFRKDDIHVIEIGARALRWQIITLCQSVPGLFYVTCCYDYSQACAGCYFVYLHAKDCCFYPFHPDSALFFRTARSEMCQAAADLYSFLLAIPLTVPILK